VEPSQEILNVVTQFFEALRDSDDEKGIEAPQNVYPLTIGTSETLAGVD
jgi:hypothetical protein